MPKTIQQTVSFSVSPKVLFDTYLNSKKHSAAIKAKASVRRKVGAPFRAFGGMLRGKNLAIVPDQMIVQSWRGADWRKTEPDSILILAFEKASRGGRIRLVHANVPDRHYAGIRRGWPKYYWRPWKAYLRRSRRK